MLGNKNKVK